MILRPATRLAHSRVLGLLLLVVLSLWGCSTTEPGDGIGEDATPDAADDVGDLGIDSDAAIDSGPDVPVEPEFVLGINQVFETSPSSFTPLNDNDTVPIVLGPQASNMVVLAFKTRGIFDRDTKVRVEGSMTINGNLEGTLELIGQDLLPGIDGYSCYYNFFLAIQPVDVPTGEPATIDFVVEDEATGHIEMHTRSVIVGEQQ